MKAHLYLIVTMLVGASSMPAWSSSSRDARVTAEVCKLESEFDRDAITHDDKALDRLLADEYQHTNFQGGVTDKKAELNFYRSPQFILGKAEIDACSVHVYSGDVAVATGINNWSEASYQGQNISGRYRFTTVYVRREGRWQIVAGHASRMRN